MTINSNVYTIIGRVIFIKMRSVDLGIQLHEVTYALFYSCTVQSNIPIVFGVFPLIYTIH